MKAYKETLECKGLPTNENELRIFLTELLGEESSILARLEIFTYEEGISPSLGFYTNSLDECLKANEIFQDSAVAETWDFHWNPEELSLYLECGFDLSYTTYLYKSGEDKYWSAEEEALPFEEYCAALQAIDSIGKEA